MIMPKISNLVIDTRKKVYIQDAKKMIANAQFKMSSSNAEIEKPEMGECIVFSLKYLALNEFNNPLPKVCLIL